MTKFYSIEPEVAGELGNETAMDSSVHPPIVTKLHYVLMGWLGDELLECFPCYIVTQALMETIKGANLSGYVFEKILIEKSEQFTELYPNKKIPAFHWIRIIGKAGIDDFGISENNLLIVSNRALDVLKFHRLNECEIEQW